MPETVDSFRTELQDTLGAAYTLEHELPGGGMSRVFVAEERALRRRVVVKVLPPELVARISLERFRREIEFAAALQHPHIVTLLAANATGDLLYYMMPFVEGQSLREHLAASGGRLAIDDAVRVGIEISGALQAAHEQGIVHRDIKPGNILLSRGHAMVTDFGVARAISRATLEQPTQSQLRSGSVNPGTLTAPGWLVGTPAYMSPEQASGVSNLDGRSDVYSVGCVLFEMLTGVTPFVGTRDEMIVARVTRVPSVRAASGQGCRCRLIAS